MYINFEYWDYIFYIPVRFQYATSVFNGRLCLLSSKSFKAHLAASRSCEAFNVLTPGTSLTTNSSADFRWNWLVVSTNPSEKWWSESQLGWWHSQLNGKIKFMFQTTTREPFQDFPIANRPAPATHPFSQLYFGTGCRVSAGAGDVLMSRSKINKSSVSEPNLAICLLKMDPPPKKKTCHLVPIVVVIVVDSPLSLATSKYNIKIAISILTLSSSHLWDPDFGVSLLNLPNVTNWKINQQWSSANQFQVTSCWTWTETQGRPPCWCTMHP